jgi:acetyltransferase-like isoleucine patch superfamily enzyme
MKTGRCYLVMLLFRLLPETRLFGLKAFLLRFIGVKVGCNVRVCSSVRILGGGSLEIGDNTWVGHETLIFSSSSIKIGSCVDIGPRVYIGTGTHEIDAPGAHSAGQGLSRDVVIGDGVWLGACSAVLPGVSIGKKAVVAAGAVVAQDVVECTIVAGIPAKLLRAGLEKTGRDVIQL